MTSVSKRLKHITKLRCGTCALLVPIETDAFLQDKGFYCCPQNRALKMEVPWFGDRCGRYKPKMVKVEA